MRREARAALISSWRLCVASAYQVPRAGERRQLMEDMSRLQKVTLMSCGREVRLHLRYGWEGGDSE
jgi:hypothetical protein